MRRLGVAFALPLAEIAVFVLVGRWTGVLVVLGLVVLAAVVGVILIRTAGDAVAAHMQRVLRRRENPLRAVGAPAFRVIAGLLLIMPGFLTDLLALVLLVPAVQGALLARAAAFAVAHRPRFADGAPAQNGEVIEGRAVEVPPPGDSESGGGGSGWTRH